MRCLSSFPAGRVGAIDLVIRNGTVHDGTGQPPVQADVAVSGGRIVEIGRIDGRASREIDADGLIVAPGFIDIHSHSDYTLLIDPRAVSAIAQGVTLEVLGNCGFGCAPIADPRLAADNIYGFTGEVPLGWRDMAGYLARLEQAGPAINVLSLVPNGQLRRSALGLQPRPADPGELARMIHLLEQALEEGAFGYSTGLEYVAEAGAPEEEITALARSAGRADAFYATHTRARDQGSVEAVMEALRTAARANVRLQISHLLPRSGRADGERAIELVDRARRDGLDVAFDMHTRLFGTTMLSTLLPAWALEGGARGLPGVLASPEARTRIRQHRSIISASGDWDRVVLLDLPRRPEFSRRSLGEIGREAGRDPHDVALDILAAHADQLNRPMVILRCLDEEQQRACFSHPLCMPGSDATTLAPDGKLAGASFHGAYSWASWFYRFMVRENRLLSAEEALHRLTGMPAAVLGLSDRGELRRGAWADLAIFDPTSFGERATVFEPNQLAQGMHHVVVNGVLTLENGLHTGRHAGQVLRRPSH